MILSSVTFLALGFQEYLLIFGVLLLMFGGKKIPELMQGIGKGIREFNSAKDGLKSEFEKGMKDEPKKELPGKE